MSRTVAIGIMLLGLIASGGCESSAHTAGGAHLHAQHHDHGQSTGHAHHYHDHDHEDAHVQENDAHALMHPAFDPSAPCTCAVEVLRHGWCRRCNHGFIAGQRIESAKLFSTLDPHGHDLNLAAMECADCREAAREGGFCEACGMGFVNRKAYFTRLTYGLAHGRAMDGAEVSCGHCRAHLGEPGWCDHCGRGIVGNVAINEKSVFDRTAREYRVLRAAIEKVEECEMCACAMVVHRTCPFCRISYEDGHPSSSSGRSAK